MMRVLPPAPLLSLVIEPGLPLSAIILLYIVVPEIVLKLLHRQDPCSDMFYEGTRGVQ